MPKHNHVRDTLGFVTLCLVVADNDKGLVRSYLEEA